jgi:hypothetical protein
LDLDVRGALLADLDLRLGLRGIWCGAAPCLITGVDVGECNKRYTLRWGVVFDKVWRRQKI